MKKNILLGLLFLCGFLILNKNVSAVSFTEDAYLANEYVVKKKDGVTYYLQLRYMHDNQKRIVFCLEPFTKFQGDKEYMEYEDAYEYNGLSDEQIRTIGLLMYYGYGNGNRVGTKWYAITQLLIWQVVDPTAPMYFTDTLNGNRIDKYTADIEALWNDVNNHDMEPEFVHEYVVNYNDELVINELNEEYEVIDSNYEEIMKNGYRVDKVVEDGRIVFKKKQENKYSNNVIIYDSLDSQDLILPGEVLNKEFSIDVKVTKGNVTLDIKHIKDAYSIDSEVKNTCYLIYNDVEEFEKVCSEEDIVYKSGYLPYGEYKVKQISSGIGYLVDNNIYSFSVSKVDEQPRLELFNKLIKNTLFIKKYYCKDSNCLNEGGAVFEIYDSKNSLVESIETDELGEASVTLGYGKYKIVQMSGMQGYKLANDFSVKIVDNVTLLEKEIHNDYIVVKQEVVDTEDLPPSEIEELPPKTGIEFPYSFCLLGLLIVGKKFF